MALGYGEFFFIKIVVTWLDLYFRKMAGNRMLADLRGKKNLEADK